MNRCEYCLENLSAYIDGELPENEMKGIEQHIMECPSCSREYEILAAIVSACGELEEELPDGFVSSLHARLEEARNEVLSKNSKIGRIRLFAQIAASFAIVIMLGFAVRMGIFDNKPILGAKSTQDMAPLAGAPPTAQYITPHESSDSTAMKFGISSANKNAESITMADPTEGISSAEIPDSSPGEKQGTEDADVSFYFSNRADLLDGEQVNNYDTEIVIVVEDINEALESIIAIDKKVGKSRENNTDYLQEYARKIKFRSNERINSVELKLVYTSEKIQQSFLEEVRSTFTNIQVESISPENKVKEEREYIRVIIEKNN